MGNREYSEIFISITTITLKRRKTKVAVLFGIKDVRYYKWTVYLVGGTSLKPDITGRVIPNGVHGLLYWSTNDRRWVSQMAYREC